MDNRMSPRIQSRFSGAIQTGSCSANIQELSSIVSASHPHSVAQRDPGRNPPKKRQETSKRLQTSPLQYSEHHRERLRASAVGSGPETGNQQRSQKRSRTANGIWDGLTVPCPAGDPTSFCCQLSVVHKLMHKPVVSEDRGLTPLCTQSFQINLFDVIRS